jgi:RNA-directed DNA polymerase
MAKGASKSAAEGLEGQEVSPVNTDELGHALYEAERRVLEIQTKLHRWAGDDAHRRFVDLFNLVADPAFLLVAGIGCRETRVPRQPESTGLLRRLSRC